MTKTLLLAAVLSMAGLPALAEAAPTSTTASDAAPNAASAPAKTKKHARTHKLRKGAPASVPLDSPYKPGQN